MSVKRIYSCNFCHDDKKSEDLLGIHWTGPGPGSIMNIEPQHSVENHICINCLKEFYKIAKLHFKKEGEARGY